MIQRLIPTNINATTYLIVVMGVSGTGKSSLARALADYYGYGFLDADDFHSESSRARMASGQPLTDEMRAPWVSAICDQLQDRATKHQHCLLAFSGLRKLHRNQLRTAGLKTLFLFLRGDRATIQERLSKRTGHFMAPALLDSQLESMEDPRTELDVMTLDISASLSCVTDQAIRIIDEKYGLHELIAK